MKRVYLCGPINGCTDAQCKDWREFAKSKLNSWTDPMRRDYRGREGDFYREIVELDKVDVRECDIVLANCPMPSVGTSMEILLAWQLGKIVVIVHPPGKISPWLVYHSTCVVSSMEEAINFINNI
jgi:hypothetical protein